MNRPSQQASADIRCLGPLKYTFNELKLLKIQLRPVLLTHGQKRQKHMEMELLLGDIHSNEKRRELYSPTSFQIPLLRQSRGESITIGKQEYWIKNTNTLATNNVNMRTPPHLNKKPHLPPFISGEWISSRCEIRPMDVYLLRRFSFDQSESKWIGEHKFFADPFCTYAKFIVTAAGRFFLSPFSEEVQWSTNIDFHIDRATLTALEEKVITDMRLTGFCGVGEWKANVPKELGPTNGCLYLGIVIPSIRFDVVKMEMDYRGVWLLFLGQADTNNLPTMDNERPTAFQLPLVKCREVATFSAGLRELLERRLYSDDPNKANSVKGTFILYSAIITYLFFFR